MKFKEFRNLVKESGSFNVKDNLEKIDYLSFLPEKSNFKPLIFRRFTALAATFIFLIMAFFTFFNFQPVTTLNVEINPKFSLEINRFNHIIAVDAENEDATRMLSEINLKNKSLEKAVELIYDYAEANGLLINDNLYILYGVMSDKESQADKIENLINNNQNDSIKPLVVHSTYYLTQETEYGEMLTPSNSNDFDQGSAIDDLQEKRETLDISNTRFALILMIIEDNPEYSFDTLAAMELNDLYDILNK